jgi:N-acetylglucosamine-6-phosphate deacetylase
MMKHTGASITDVFRFASLNPARLLGMDSRGEIRVGNHADLIITDNQMSIEKVLLDGDEFEL